MLLQCRTVCKMTNCESILTFHCLKYIYETSVGLHLFQMKGKNGTNKKHIRGPLTFQMCLRLASEQAYERNGLNVGFPKHIVGLTKSCLSLQ